MIRTTTNMRKTRPPRRPNSHPSSFARWSARLCGLTLACLPWADAGAQDAAALDRLERENQELRRRLETLEAVAQREGLIPSGQPATKPVTALSDVIISGFVQASYFYNTDRPSDGYSDGYLWNTKHNSFSLNKFKLTIASPPVERSGDDWDAGYRVSMIWGEDAPVLNTGGEYQGFEALREAYVDLNVPIGDGLNVKIGQLISLLNYESGDGGAVNVNFSQGYQWFFTGNGPSAGIQASYGVTDWLELTARVQNGLYQGPIDSNDAKTYMGKIGLKPGPNTWLALIGFGGSESDTLDLLGGSLLAGHSFTPKLGVGLEFDYFQFDTGETADLWSVGGWVWYDFTDKLTLAFRGEYLKDEDGGGLRGINLPGRPNSAILSPDPDGDIASLTLTLTYKPFPSLRTQPELRYDTTAYSGGYDGGKERLTIGAGISYLF
ncbi:MAG TPA: outer membrane beta-barrel protein [Verrucomicrobiota bacterium]|nr:outer membrane beta-barrel protein [Verrucomicrobiota bacterium]